MVDTKNPVVVGLVSFVELGRVCALGCKVPVAVESMLEVDFTAMAVCFRVFFRSSPMFFAEFRGVEVFPAIAYIMDFVQMFVHLGRTFLTMVANSTKRLRVIRDVVSVKAFL